MPRSRKQTSAARTKNRRSGRNAQWAAQFAVASELCKRGYEVAFTLGHNTPLADLMVISPQKRHFLIDVKGLSGRNPWLVKRKQGRDNLYYVLAFVPEGTPNEFFVLSQKHANRLVEEHFQRPSNRTRPGWDGFSFSAPERYRNRWDILPR
jgi:hypothetical protein